MKFILFISLIVIITLAGNVFAKDYLIEQSNEKNIKCYENYFTNLLKVEISENLGEVKVTDTKNKPLSKVSLIFINNI